MNADAIAVDATLGFGLSAPRVAVGLIWQETNSFNPQLTEISDFVIHTGSALVEAYEDTMSSLGGIIRKLRMLGAVPVPVLAAKARPGGPVRAEAIEDIVNRMVSGIVEAAPDAVCLELHGSTVSEQVDDVEGLLLARLRAALGPQIPISIALDLHGHLTEQMMQNADFLTGYRTHPHADMAETGERAAAVLAAMMTRNVQPVPVRVSLPFLALFRDETNEKPMQMVHQAWQQTSAAKDPAFLDLSIFNVHPFLDLPSMGQVVLGYGNGDVTAAKAVATIAADKLWELRSEFSGNPPILPEIFDEIVRLAAQPNPRPVAVGDQGDSVLAGSPGDSIAIMDYARQHFSTLRGFAPVFDPDVVEAVSNRVGDIVTIRLGGTVTPSLAPLEMRVVVERVTDGQFPNIGAYMTGLENDLGPCAILREGTRIFFVTSRAPAACDPNMVRHAGYELEDFDYIVMKSGNHYRLSFEDSCHCLVAATPGLSSRYLDHLLHQRSRPIYPVDAFSDVLSIRDLDG